MVDFKAQKLGMVAFKGSKISSKLWRFFFCFFELEVVLLRRCDWMMPREGRQPPRTDV